MAIKILGLDGVSPAGVDASQGSLITSVWPDPDKIITYESMGLQSGALAGVGNGQGVFAFRYFGQSLLLVKRVGVGFITTTAFTTAQVMSFSMLAAKQYQQFETGGTQIFAIPNSINLQHHNMKRRQSFSHFSGVDIRISINAALIAAAQRATASHTMGIVSGYSGGVGVTIPPALDNLFSHHPGDRPFICRFNEGFLVVTSAAMGAAGVGVFYINLEFAEIPEF